MSKKRNRQVDNSSKKKAKAIPEGFLQGEQINHPIYGHGFIAEVSPDGKKIDGKFGSWGTVHTIILPDELPRLFECEQTEAVVSFLDQKYGHYECRMCHKRLFPDFFTPEQKKLYRLDKVCEQCARIKFKCPICHDEFYLKREPVRKRLSVLICHTCFQEFFTGISAPVYLEPHPFEYFQDKGISRKDFNWYLLDCHDLFSIISAYSLATGARYSQCYSQRYSWPHNEDRKNHYVAFLKPILERIMRINGASQEFIDSKIDSFPLQWISLSIDRKCDFREPFGSHYIITPSEFRRLIESCINNIEQHGRWVLLEDREHEPLHSVTQKDFKRALDQISTYSYDVPERRDDFRSYEDMSEYYTKREFIPDYDEMYRELSDAFDEVFESPDGAADVQASIQSQLDDKSRTLFVCNGIMRCEQEYHNISSIRLTMPTISNELVEFNANYCADCDTLYIYRSDYEYYRDRYGLPLIQFASQDKDSTNEYGAEDSILSLAGYSVSAANNLSAEQRQQILVDLVAAEMITKSRIIMYINWFISHNGKIAGHKNAVDKWKEDLKFMYSLDFDRQMKMRADKISGMRKGSRRSTGSC